MAASKKKKAIKKYWKLGMAEAVQYERGGEVYVHKFPKGRVLLTNGKILLIRGSGLRITKARGILN